MQEKEKHKKEPAVNLNFNEIVKSAFKEALEINSEEEEKYLNEKCGNDTELRKEIITLLKAYGSSNDFIKMTFFLLNH